MTCKNVARGMILQARTVFKMPESDSLMTNPPSLYNSNDEQRLELSRGNRGVGKLASIGPMTQARRSLNGEMTLDRCAGGHLQPSPCEWDRLQDRDDSTGPSLTFQKTVLGDRLTAIA